MLLHYEDGDAKLTVSHKRSKKETQMNHSFLVIMIFVSDTAILQRLRCCSMPISLQRRQIAA